MGKKYKKAESFKYLGLVMTRLNDIETEIKSKIAIGNKCYEGKSLNNRNFIITFLQEYL